VSSDASLMVFAFTARSMLCWVVIDGESEFKERQVTPAQVAALANTLTVQVNRNPAREDLWRRTLAQLYELVFGDLPGVRSARDLVIVPDGPLHRLPFGSLFDATAGQYVFERTAVRLAPNIAFALGRPARAIAPLSALVVGDPELAGPQAPLFARLSDARREAIEVGNLYRQPTVMLGRDATKPRVLAAIALADVIHFAGHAVSSPSMTSPRLLLAGDPRNPANAISAADLAGQFKKSTTVVLAACETGATTFDRAASLTSISSAFLRAGADSVVAALWPLDDSSGAAFFPAVHRELLRGQPTSIAVARAQRACRSDQTCRGFVSTWIGTTVYGHQ
jgi:CHAT domain-containing protein